MAGVSAGVVLLILIIVFSLPPTYQNARLGYKISYPKDWDIKADDKTGVVSFVSPLENALDPFRENVNVAVKNIEVGRMTMPRYSDQFIRSIPMMFKNVHILDKGSDLVSGQEFRYVTFQVSAELTLKVYMIWTIKDSKAYQITYTAEELRFDTYFPEVEKMVHSFHIR